jgi:hypothetical protein
VGTCAVSVEEEDAPIAGLHLKVVATRWVGIDKGGGIDEVPRADNATDGDRAARQALERPRTGDIVTRSAGETGYGEVEEEAPGREAPQSDRARRVDQPTGGGGLKAVARGTGKRRDDGRAGHK